MLRGSTADFVSVQCQPAEAPGFNASEPPRPSAQATLQALLRFGATPPIKQIRFSRWQDGLSAPSGVHLAQGSCQPGYAMCPNGKCCATGMQCTDDGFCVQPGRIYCGGGRSCSAGESCARDGFCVGAGLVYCGGGRTCPSGTTCTNDGKCNDPKRPACPPGQGLCASGKCCPDGTTCTNDGYCVQPGRVYCGGGVSCPADTRCTGQGTCSAPGSGAAPAPSLGRN